MLTDVLYSTVVTGKKKKGKEENSNLLLHLEILTVMTLAGSFLTRDATILMTLI